MRDFRDAKTMAQTLRESLTTKSVTISHSESLELVFPDVRPRRLEYAVAMLQSTRRDTTTPARKTSWGSDQLPGHPVAGLRSVPVRELPNFRGSWWLQRVLSPRPPSTDFPMFAWREKTIRTLNHAFGHHREVVLAVQRQADVDEPGFEDIHEIGGPRQTDPVRPAGPMAH